MPIVVTVTWEEGRACIRDRMQTVIRSRPAETVSLLEADGRVLAEDVPADRDYPAAARSVRDGFAVRSTDLPGTLKIVGEVRAGTKFDAAIGPGESVEIMTGAPVPAGADQIVMVEHAQRVNGGFSTGRPANMGEFINPQASEARAGETILATGKRLGFADIAWLATVGRSEASVYPLPRVAILATGDEIVDLAEVPLDTQIRNSNAYSLAVQVRRAGGIPEILPVAPDEIDETRRLIQRGLQSDLLLLSGGVSAGKYDLVEQVLADLGAEFFFDRVRVQPGQPLVFGKAQGTFFFGLPGNPASTMVTFEVFAQLALCLLGGEPHPALPLSFARLTQDFAHKPGLTRFLPAVLNCGDITPVAWKGSSDVPSIVKANAFLVADAARETWAAGDMIGVLPK